MATCAGLVGSATLKDLAPSEKAKVTQLMHKIVEQGQQLQAVREQCIQEVGKLLSDCRRTTFEWLGPTCLFAIYAQPACWPVAPAAEAASRS